MRPTKIIAAIFLFAIAFCGCKKEAVEVNGDMEGTWEQGVYNSPYCRGVRITINAGKSEWYSYPQNSSNTGENGSVYTGKAKIKDDRFILKKIDLHIDEYPHYDATGNYVMVLQGTTYYGAIFPNQYTAQVSNDTTRFSWYANGEDNSTIVVEYKTATAATWSTVTYSRQENWDMSANESTGILTGLQPGTTYQWKMKSVNGKKESLYTPVQTFTTQ